MMLYPSLPELLDHVNSRYMLVNVIAHRARELEAEAEETGVPLEKKAVSCAIDEIASGKYAVNCETENCDTVTCEAEKAEEQNDIGEMH